MGMETRKDPVGQYNGDDEERINKSYHSYGNSHKHPNTKIDNKTIFGKIDLNDFKNRNKNMEQRAKEEWRSEFEYFLENVKNTELSFKSRKEMLKNLLLLLATSTIDKNKQKIVHILQERTKDLPQENEYTEDDKEEFLNLIKNTKEISIEIYNDIF